MKVRKAASEGRQRTWLSLSKPGREALRSHLAALKAMMAGVPEI